MARLLLVIAWWLVARAAALLPYSHPLRVYLTGVRATSRDVIVGACCKANDAGGPPPVVRTRRVMMLDVTRRGVLFGLLLLVLVGVPGLLF